MTTKRYSEKIAAILDSLSKDDRALLQAVLDKGFDDEAARELFDEGAAEEQRFGASPGGADHPDLMFVPSSLRDLGCFGEGETKKQVNLALSGLGNKIGTPDCVPVYQRNGWILREGPYRIVFRPDAASSSVVVLGIACWACNPRLKIWRYLDQRKAEDLVQTGELYFRRVDLLEDKYESTPTLWNYLDYQAVTREAFPAASEDRETVFERHKRATYVCCWRMSPHESWLAWKQYCQQEGGFAVQTTRRKLAHLHAHLRQGPVVSCQAVSYIDHRGENPRSDGLGSEAFYKAVWFSDEQEIRLARFHYEYVNVTREGLKTNPALVPDCQRIKCDLSSIVESIVINPFAKEAEKAALTKLIEQHQPSLLPKIRPSAILRPPVGSVNG